MSGDYARYLVASGFANSVVRTYYIYVASWCGWTEGQGYLPRHSARESDAEDPLLDDDGRRPGDQQAWSPQERDLLTRYVDEQADATFDALGGIEVPSNERGDLTSDTYREKIYARFDAIKRCRERAFAYVLCYTPLRGSKFLDSPDDDRPGRNGLRWADDSFQDKNATVFRKKPVGRSLPPGPGPRSPVHSAATNASSTLPRTGPSSPPSTARRLRGPSPPRTGDKRARHRPRTHCQPRPPSRCRVRDHPAGAEAERGSTRDAAPHRRRRHRRRRRSPRLPRPSRKAARHGRSDGPTGGLRRRPLPRQLRTAGPESLPAHRGRRTRRLATKALSKTDQRVREHPKTGQE